ncbi:hypothetical protein EJB05_55054, partial [Eragrostis curvula]
MYIDHFVIHQQDYTLSQSLIRVSSYYVADLQSQPPFNEAHYGSVKKVYVICKKDVAEVRELAGADHMPMFSTPAELAGHLADVANTSETNGRSLSLKLDKSFERLKTRRGLQSQMAKTQNAKQI